jgi:hypothetical protein
VVNFPIFERLDVDGYQLYPGRRNAAGLHLRLSRGPWIVLGVNGLGKSTLLLLLKHLLTGPVAVRGAGFTGDRPDLVNLDNRFFAQRVGDSAESSCAAIAVRFGTTTLKVQRRLSNLALIEAIVAGVSEKITDEVQYREVLSSIMGLARFDDALRVLDRVSFFLEDRTSLIWDVSAQFELFRALLTPEISNDLRRLEGEIVSNDSAARNLNAALFKLVSRRDAELAKREKSSETQAQLAIASAELEVAEEKRRGTPSQA